ncbi:MAG: pilus assembly protein TadG-related protein [Nocardioidaceae bacterium]
MRRDRNEKGVTAIIVGLSSVLLFSMAAMAVDLGNAYSRKRDVQNQADFAAIAAAEGGKNLPAPHATPIPTDPAVIAAVNYLNRNRPQNDAKVTDCVPKGTLVTAAMLTNGLTCDGQVYFGHWTHATPPVFVPSLNEITVLTPTSDVDFGLAGVMGFTDTHLATRATVAIKSAKIPVLPFYAYSGCDYGPQTISEPNNGHAASSVLLSHPTETNAATLTTISPVTVTPGDTTSSLVINGTGLGSVTQVGFFESGNGSAGPEPVIVNVTGATSTRVTVPAPLPSAVTGVQNVWYVRVKIGANWSAVTTGSGNNQILAARTFTVGNSLLTCGQGSSDGNFGTLKFQSTGQWQVTARNIALGLPHDLAPFPNPASNWMCTNGVNLAKTWDGLTDGTNCVDTETGMAQNAATAGFVIGISGGGGFNGLLTKNTSSPTNANAGCAANGLPATKPFLNKTINNDTLSCFFNDTTTNIGQIVSSTYSLPGPVLNKNIWSSPRFVFVPVLGMEPTQGGSNKYQIIDFRPGFITDQTEPATKATLTSATNGLTPSSNGNEVQSVQIVFFNPAALPPPPGGLAVTDYRPGSGTKILRLVD